MLDQSNALGVIMLDTEFPRPVGDVGHPGSWSMPVRFKRVAQASPERVIRQGNQGLTDDFIQAGQDLVNEGCSALITSCGFLAKHQRVMAQALPVPFAASSLVQLPAVQALLGTHKKVGVITYDAANLGADHFLACGADPNTPVIGVPDGGAFRALIEGGAPYDASALETEIVSATRRLLQAHQSIGAILLECTNMPPFAKAITQAVNLPVFDILTAGHWLYQSTQPRDFPKLQKRAI